MGKETKIKSFVFHMEIQKEKEGIHSNPHATVRNMEKA